MNKKPRMCSSLAWRSFPGALPARGSRILFPLLLLFALVLGPAFSAQAAGVLCSDFGGVVDGSNPATYAAVQSASTFGIDMNCTIKNFPQAVGGFPITNINFNFPQQQSYYIAFLDVFYYGNMSCNDPTQSEFWIYWAPGGFNNISPSCQAFMVPVDAVLKQNPSAQTTAAVGVPFTYTITVPVMGKLDATGTFQYMADADDSDITNAVVTDDLTATGAALTYVSNAAFLVNRGTGARTPLNGGLPLTPGASSTWLANHYGVLSDSTKHLVFSYEYNPDLASIPAGYNVELALTVVLDNAPSNVNPAQTQFSNTARMWFDKTINTTNMIDLQAQPGATQPMTVSGPNLVVTKTSSETNLNLGVPATFTIDVLNNGSGDAWNATISDQLPDGPNGGMCDYNPATAAGLSARVFAADGVTPVSGPLVKDTDYSVTYSGAPDCRLGFTMLTSAAKIGPAQHLIINYQSQIDIDSKNGVALTNVAGALRWFSGDSSLAGRRQYDQGPLTNGTPGVLDFQDRRTVTTALTGYYFQKTVADLTRGTNPATTAAPGDRLRYRLRLFNVDQTINGITISDVLDPNSFELTTFSLVTPPPAGTVYSFDVTSGLLTLSGNPDPLNVPAGDELAVEFEVTLKGTLTGGAVDNQATLSAANLTAASDDPNVNGIASPGDPGDPTRVVIQAPLIARKTASLAVDDNSNGLVDPGDVLLYSITVTNPGVVPATGARLTDDVPAYTTYVANTATLNGLPLGQPDGGVLPLASGAAINSPGSAGGTIAANSSAFVAFRVTVNAGVPTGTAISNVGYVNSDKQPIQPTDSDGGPGNGDQPTVVVVGTAEQVVITKEVLVVGGGAALPGSQLEYVVRVTNTGAIPATNLVITDDLTQLSGKAAYVAGSATFNNATTGLSYTAPVLTADYAATYGELLPGETATLRFRAVVDNDLATGTRITNTAQMTWSTPTLTATAGVSIDIGGVAGSAMIGGQVWRDANLNKVCDADETDLTGWTVGIYRNNVLVTSVTTTADGLYTFSGLEPTLTASGRYELRFTAPGAGQHTASLGWGDSTFTNGPQRISDIVASSGSNLRNMNLPLSPNGAVYDSVQRTPVAGATVTMLNGTTNEPLPAVCFDDPAQQNQVTAAGGSYKFDLNFNDAACAPGGTYLIAVTPPGSGYAAGPSRIIPQSGEPAAPFSVLACSGSADDAIPASTEYCEITASASAPPSSVPPRTNGTIYHLYLALANASGQGQVFNNHIPVDPLLDGAVAITKTSPLINVSKGQLVPYTIAMKNVVSAPLSDLVIIDRFPAGFKYVEGSARLDGTPREPGVSGRELTWDGIGLQFNETRTLQLLLVVGAGVSEGEYVNRAQVLNSATGGSVSGEATATVRVIPDPTFDCTDVIGKVFDDRNLNGRQDSDEKGLSGVRVVTARGLIAASDEHGRFHITCAVVPDEDRGSNFILKLDERSLPTGYRMTTENPRVQRATRGKLLRFSFGATIHHVVRIDIADGVFEPDSIVVRMQWTHKIGEVLEELKRGPSVLRLSYLADVEGRVIAWERLEALKKEIIKQWEETGGGYRLDIETEIFRRRGEP